MTEDSRRDLQDEHLNSLLPDVQVDRRGFVAACLAAGFAVAAEPVLAQAIKTSMDGLDGGDIKIGEIPAYYAVPIGKGKRPVVIVVPEVFGLHEHIKDVVRRLGKAGYFAVSRRRRQDRPAGAGALRREVPDPRLRRHAARLQRRLPAELPQGGGRRRLEAHARLVQEAPRSLAAGRLGV